MFAKGCYYLIRLFLSMGLAIRAPYSSRNAVDTLGLLPVTPACKQKKTIFYGLKKFAQGIAVNLHLSFIVTQPEGLTKRNGNKKEPVW